MRFWSLKRYGFFDCNKYQNTSKLNNEGCVVYTSLALAKRDRTFVMALTIQERIVRVIEIAKEMLFLLSHTLGLSEDFCRWLTR